MSILENTHVPAHENQDSFKNLDLNTKVNPEKTERLFNFKIKIIQTDLAAGNNFSDYLQSLNNSNVPFMVQHSGYIEKLNFLNSFEGGTLARRQDDRNERAGRYPGGFEENVFQANVADPEILEDFARRKEEMLRDAINGYGSPEILMQNLLDKLAEITEEWDYEELDILGNLYVFDVMGGTDREYEEDEEEFWEDGTPESGNNLEIKFDTTGSIKFLENNILEVKYDESGMVGVRDAFVRFLFDFNKKDFVTIHRRGETDVWLNCKKGERINGSVKSRSFGSNITVDTKELINNITPLGGRLYISYIRETDGAPSEMVTHIISALPVKK